MPSVKRLARSRRHFALRTDMPKQAWHNRIVGHADVDPSALLANPSNWRVHPKHQQDALKGVIDEVGFVSPVLVQAGTDTVIDGHMRVTLALRNDEPTIPVTYLDLDDREAALILATFDPISALAATDAAQLDALLREVSTSDAAVMQMLSDLAEQEGVIGFGEPEAGLTDPDEVPEPPSDPVTKPGDLWILGRHRLLCGDSTNREDVDRLMNGEKADTVLTDPPYSSGGFQETGKASGSIGARGGKKILNDALSTRGYRNLMQDALGCCPDAHTLLVFCDWKMWIENFDIAERAGFRVRNMIVWDKQRMGMGMPFRNQHELVLFASKVAGKIGDGDTPNVLPFPRDSNELHHTPKPVELLAGLLKPIDAEVVYDSFGGSGSTLIACEQTERVCRMMEIDPHYCDVIVQRWENFTGQQAHREAVS